MGIEIVVSSPVKDVKISPAHTHSADLDQYFSRSATRFWNLLQNKLFYFFQEENLHEHYNSIPFLSAFAASQGEWWKR